MQGSGSYTSMASSASGQPALPGRCSLYRWLMVAVIAVAVLLLFLQRLNLSVAVIPWGEQCGWTEAEQQMNLGAFFYGALPPPPPPPPRPPSLLPTSPSPSLPLPISFSRADLVPGCCAERAPTTPAGYVVTMFPGALLSVRVSARGASLGLSQSQNVLTPPVIKISCRTASPPTASSWC